MALSKEQQLNETMRVVFEQAPGPVGGQILSELRRIEAAAAALREEGKNGSEIRQALGPQIDDLKAGTSRAYRETAQSYRRAINERVDELVEQREKKPELGNFRLTQAQNRIDALTSEEAGALASKYAADEADLSLDELNLLSRRLDRAGDAEQHKALRQVMTEKRAHEWWLSDDEAASYDAQAELLERGASGKIPVAYDGQVFDVPLDSLLDIDGELDVET